MSIHSLIYSSQDLKISLNSNFYLNEKFCDNLNGTQNKQAVQDEEGNIKNPSSVSPFDCLLITLWETAMTNGLFRYKLSQNSLPFKVLPGRFDYIAQLNPDRAQKRRKPQEIQSVNQPFSSGEFNFNKIDKKEILLRLRPYWEKGEDKDNDHFLLINVSPLEYGHVLLTPFQNKNRPQTVFKEGLRLAIELCLLSGSCDFRVGFNSLCGFASVNHEHYHAYYLSHRLYIEYAPLKPLANKYCFQLEDSGFPPGFCFLFALGNEEEREVCEDSLGGFIESVVKLASYLQESNTAHNLYITRGSTKNLKGHFDCIRVFLWARTSSFGAKGCDAFNPALCELAGHFPIKNEASYSTLTEEFILEELHEICDKPFEVVRDWIVSNL